MALRENAKLDNKNDHSGLRLDATDLENIKRGIEIYERLYPRGKVHVMDEQAADGKPVRYIEYCNLSDHLDYMRKQLKNERKLKHRSLKTSTETIQLRISVPPTFEAFITKAYPKLFTDEGQTNQFLRAFPHFDLTRG